MKGMILDYTGNDAFILLEDDSIITIPLLSIIFYLKLVYKVARGA